MNLPIQETQDPFKKVNDLIDHEARMLVCWQAVIDLLHHNPEASDPKRTLELIEFVHEEYMAAREDLLEHFLENYGFPGRTGEGCGLRCFSDSD